MQKTTIKSLANMHGGYFYDYDDEGSLLLNKTGERILHLVNPDGAEDAERQISNVRDFFAKTDDDRGNEDNSISCMPSAFIDVECDHIENPTMLENLLADTVLLLKEHVVYLRIHFDNPKPSWKEFFQHFIECCVDTFKPNYPIFHLCGQFTLVSDLDKEFLFLNGFRLFYAHDIASVDVPFSVNDQQVVEDIAEYGFRMPFLWYVQEKNIDIIPEIIEEAMRLNYNAGFALPSIHDTIFPVANARLSFDNYLRLLIIIYQKYPDYDEVLIPLNALLQDNLSRYFSRKENQNYRFNQLTSQLEKIEMDDFHIRIKDFWDKVFLWQFWKISQAFTATTQ